MTDKRGKEKGKSNLLSPIRQDDSLLHLNDSFNNTSLISLIPCKDENTRSKKPGPDNNINNDTEHDANTPPEKIDFHHPHYFGSSADAINHNLNKNASKETDDLRIENFLGKPNYKGLDPYDGLLDREKDDTKDLGNSSEASEKKSKRNSVMSPGFEFGSGFQIDTIKPDKIEEMIKVKITHKMSQRCWSVNKKIIESSIFQIIVTMFTIYALFADDARLLFLPKSADSILDIFTLTCLLLFAYEIIISVKVKNGYYKSFFFWLDVLSTVSLILDIGWINQNIFAQDSAANATQLARAGRASRIGTKAGRVVRLVRLFRIVKLYKNVKDKDHEAERKKLEKLREIQEKIEKKIQLNSTIKRSNSNSNSNSYSHQSASLTNSVLMVSKRRRTIELQKEQTSIASIDNPLPVPDLVDLKESRVGKKLSEMTTKRVICLVLLLLLSIPLFEAEYYFDDDQSYIFGQKLVINITQESIDRGENFTRAWRSYDDFKVRHINQNHPLVYASFPTLNITFQTSDYFDLRNDEKDTNIFIDEKTQIEYKAVIDLRNSVHQVAGLNIGRTLYVCLVLTLGALFFSKDANDMALRPIERMIEKVNKIAMNPLSARDETLVKEKLGDVNETLVIENAISKIGTLLAVGFGEAGSEIIALNMSKDGDVDPMIPGQKKYAIYGFCDIRNFTDATEVLQEDVMVFVNTIAEIVHQTVDRYGGAANKNIGDAFLLVWKVPRECYVEENGIFHINPSRATKNVADMALLSFIKIISAINRRPQILNYRQNEKLNKRLPNYQVRMGFGLHVGWAIEGAIGSEYKIDASYLSPNVNMASRLEAATKQYGVYLLISDKLYKLFSKKVKNVCRQIDCVTVKGSIEPVGLFTIDFNIPDLPPSKENMYSPEERKAKHRLVKRFLHNGLENGDIKANSLLTTVKDIFLIMQVDHRIDLYHTFAQGFQNYIRGDWTEAQKYFKECLEKFSDGPSKTLLSVMRDSNFECPRMWAGYRELTEK